MWILPLIAVVAATTPAPVSVPPPIKLTLDQEYPGWKIASVSKEVKDAFAKRKATRSPSFQGGDFDNDGKKDFAIQIALTTIGEEEQIIMVFLAREESYSEHILQSMGLDPNTYLWVEKKSLPTTGPDAQESPSSKTILRVLGGPAGDVVYAYEIDRFTEITLKDQLDTPDSSIPYVDTTPL